MTKRRAKAAPNVIYTDQCEIAGPGGTGGWFWCVLPRGMPQGMLRHAKFDFTELAECGLVDGISFEILGHTITLRGPFRTEAEVEENQRHVLLGPDCLIEEGGEVTREQLDLLVRNDGPDVVN
jgi:hypothetical protein